MRKSQFGKMLVFLEYPSPNLHFSEHNSCMLEECEPIMGRNMTQDQEQQKASSGQGMWEKNCCWKKKKKISLFDLSLPKEEKEVEGKRKGRSEKWSNFWVSVIRPFSTCLW